MRISDWSSDVCSSDLDAYPGEVFEGRVDRIGHAANSQFALLPRLNESGTFTKVTQRIEVRIAVDQRDGRLRPGMMVEVSIDAPHDRLWPFCDAGVRHRRPPSRDRKSVG